MTKIYIPKSKNPHTLDQQIHPSQVATSADIKYTK